MDRQGKTIGDGKSLQWCTPITIPGSSPLKSLSGLSRVAVDIVADIYNNIQMWNENHMKGANITKSIVHIKTNSSNVHPDGLESLTDALYAATQKLSGIAKALQFLASQMNALVKVNKTQTPLFATLSNDRLANLVEEIAEAYQLEFKIKEDVLECISHSTYDGELMFYAVCWTHQKNITNDINLKLEALLTETGHRKIT